MGLNTRNVTKNDKKTSAWRSSILFTLNKSRDPMSVSHEVILQPTKSAAILRHVSYMSRIFFKRHSVIRHASYMFRIFFKTSLDHPTCFLHV